MGLEQSGHLLTREEQLEKMAKNMLTPDHPREKHPRRFEGGDTDPSEDHEWHDVVAHNLPNNDKHDANALKHRQQHQEAEAGHDEGGAKSRVGNVDSTKRYKYVDRLNLVTI